MHIRVSTNSSAVGRRYAVLDSGCGQPVSDDRRTAHDDIAIDLAQPRAERSTVSGGGHHRKVDRNVD
jgi:hypothetical protein